MRHIVAFLYCETPIIYIVAPLVFSLHKFLPQINIVSYFSSLAWLNELHYSVGVKQHGDVLINRGVPALYMNGHIDLLFTQGPTKTQSLLPPTFSIRLMK